jgi:4-amino-4-deoxy-L-arabinose transferase-like glycosyltransferase
MSKDSITRWAALSLALGYVLLVLPTLGRNRLMDVDELTHARAALEAARDGHWLPLTLGGKPWMEKPPLLPWLSALDLKAGLPAEVAMRWWPLAGAALSLYFLVRLAVLASGSLSGGLLGSLLLAGQVDFLFHSRFFTMDTSLLACFLGAVWNLASVFDRETGAEAEGRFLWAGFWLALGVWIKSWFVLAFFPALALSLALRPHWPFKLQSFLARVVLPPVLSLAAWMLLYARAYGASFLTQEWTVNLAGRVAGKVESGVAVPNGLFYLVWASQSAPVLVPFFLPVIALLLRQVVRGKGSAGGGWSAAFTAGLLVSWGLGLLAVDMRVVNYLLVPTSFTCLGLAAAGMDLGAFAWVVCLLLSLASLDGSWDPRWIFGLSLIPALGVALADGRRKVSRTLGTACLMILAILAWIPGKYYRSHPPDPNRAIVNAVLANPASRPGETLLYAGHATQALDFYSLYRVTQVPAPPDKPPSVNLLVERDGKAYFYRAHP